MPRENRKRGKKHKGKHLEGIGLEGGREDIYYQTFNQDAPASFLPGNAEASSLPPFGPLDPNIKAYFKTVDDQLREWQEQGIINEVETDVDPNEQRRMFFAATLAEMNGKELQLATDPDCSPILERMLYSMDDFARRVFTDSLAGSWLILMRDRFASHVCQLLLTIVADTVTRETRGIFPPVPSSSNSGELLTMCQLIVNVCEDLLPEITDLVQDPFASHVLRALLLLLAPQHLASLDFRSTKHTPFARSKKSALWKAHRGPMKAVIHDDSQSLQPPSGRAVGCNDLSRPEEFSTMASMILSQFLDKLGDNEVRALALNKVASPVLQMVLALEAAVGMADTPGSIMDRVLEGLIANSDLVPSSYVSSLFLDATSSHLSESILSLCSFRVFARLWERYFIGDLPKLATHPVANYVVARAVKRLNAERLDDTIVRLHLVWSKMIKVSRIGVLIAMVDRASQIGAHEARMVEAICSMFELNVDTQITLLLPCVLRLQRASDYQEEQDKNHNSRDASRAEADAGEIKHGRIPAAPHMQGSILLQSALRLHEPYNNIVLESLYSLLPAELLRLACNVTSSRILDVSLESSTVPLRARKRLVQSFIGQFHLLVDDRIGSRVADRCWEAADPYLKEKIGRSLLPHEQFLAGSHYGRFFTPKLSLHLLRRNPAQWKKMQSKEDGNSPTAAKEMPDAPYKIPHQRLADMETSTAVYTSSRAQSKRKRKKPGDEDEIDVLFAGIETKRVRAGLGNREEVRPIKSKIQANVDETILKAIKSAPSDARIDRK